MTYLKLFFKWLILAFTLLVIALYLTDTDYILKAVRTLYFRGHSTAFLDDYKRFDYQIINKGPSKPWPEHSNYNTVKASSRLEKAHQDWQTVAFVIIKNDSIWYEKYYDGYNSSSKSNSFSMAKSYVSGLLGKAIMEGYIKDLNQPICDFLPQFCEGEAKTITVGDLSSMASGTDWDEAYYSPLSITTRAYFHDNLTSVINRLKIVDTPGKQFKYASGDTQMLAMVLEKATGQKLYDYFEKSFWKPLESENETLWQIDSEAHDMVKAYCCIASNAKDFARFGKLYKDFGRWNGKQILDSAFVKRSLTPRFKESPQYGYGWWLKKQNDKNFFMMRGHLGQYVIVQPEDNVIIVRLGHQKSPGSGVGIFTQDISLYISEAYKMMNTSNN